MAEASGTTYQVSEKATKMKHAIATTIQTAVDRRGRPAVSDQERFNRRKSFRSVRARLHDHGFDDAKIAARVGRAESTIRLWTSTAWTITAAPSPRILNDLRSEARRLERLSAEGRPDGNTAAIIEARECLAQAETVMAGALARAKAILDAAVPPSRQDEEAERAEVAA